LFGVLASTALYWIEQYVDAFVFLRVPAQNKTQVFTHLFGATKAARYPFVGQLFSFENAEKSQ
jgi:hypothetical protein